MKKFTITAIVILAISLAMVFIGAIFQGVTLNTTRFDIEPLASALESIGFIGAALAGIVLTGFGVSSAVRGDAK